MKYLLVLTVVLVALWIWRHNRQVGDAPSAHRNPTPPKTPAPIVACAHCGVHLPQSDALHGAQGWYCSQEHRRLSEG